MHYQNVFVVCLFSLGFCALSLSSCSNATQDTPSAAGTIRAKDVQSGKTTWVDPNELQRGPVRHDSLTSEQMERISALQKVFSEHDGQTTEQWVDNFKRDSNPDNELAVWERMANAYTRYCDSHELTTDAKNEVYKIVLLRSMASPEDVISRLKLNTVSEQDARQIMADF